LYIFIQYFCVIFWVRCDAQNEYEKRIKTLQEEGIDTKYIKKTINKSVENLDKNIKSFVIYGEPFCHFEVHHKSQMI
jgi:hypothetical protein